MKTDLFRRCLEFFRGKIEAPFTARQNIIEYPLLSDLFSIDKLEKHGESMARVHVIDYSTGRDKLLSRLAENEIMLKDIFLLLTDEETSKLRLPPAGVWLLDNFYLISEQILTARTHLPEKYSRTLPRLGSGSSMGLPRVYDIVQELISHVDGRIDEGNLRSIVAGYQKIVPLKLGELWAIPIMLRLALIENLRRVSTRIIGSWLESKRAIFWADKMIATAGIDPQNIILDMADMARADIPLTSAFISEIARRLQSQNGTLILPLTWLEQRLAQQSSSIEEQIQTENNNQATNQISISNSISSLRFLMTVDWKNFVESNSAVDRHLAKDPSGDYQKMDFATRDRYRHAIEKLARQSCLSEVEIAFRAIEIAQETISSKKRHVGYYLVDRGRTILEKSIQTKHSLREICEKIGRKAPVLFYLSAIFIVTIGLSSLILRLESPLSIKYYIIGSIILLICISQLAITLINRLATIIISPAPLPKMEFSSGIPLEMKTLVTVPAMLSSENEINKLLNKMEVCYLSNNDENILFSLLTDFLDAPKEHMDGDSDLLSFVRNGIKELNVRYSTRGVRPFMLFHRSRQWNKCERVWMGYERKRGKLDALNKALRSNTPGELLVEGDPAALEGIRYVITLDTDTQLPRDAARHLIETMAHPLNRPVYDSVRRIVTEGYTILQPRVVSNHPTARTSYYARIFGSDSGIDPYTRAVSDVYQDLSGDGSFVGKGIYDLDMFNRVLNDRLPENRILSHDLLEGTYCRSGLVSDIQFVDEFPGHYRDDIMRRYRWIRGDWQIASWILPWVPEFKHAFTRNPLSLLSRWKIFDNLRRSAVSPGMLLLIILGLFAASPQWTGLVIAAAILCFPIFMETFMQTLNKPKKYLLRIHLKSVAESTFHHITKTFFDFAFLPYDAYININAIIRTMCRLVLGRKLLEWKSHHEAMRAARKDLLSYFLLMGIVPVFMIALLYMLMLKGKGSPVIFPAMAAWILSPVLAWLISRPLTRRREVLSAKGRDFLRKISRKTWRFFETFSGSDNNWLPADNYQEEPVEAIARRTSPTNIGLMLLSNLGAYDLGYISSGQLIDSTVKSFKTLEGMERFRGHFYNWYDTQTLKPLPPGYISTVDSGNMSGYILTLRRGILDLKGYKIFPDRFFMGLFDTIQVLEELLVQPLAILSVLFVPKTPVEDALHTLTKTVAIFKRTSVSLSEIFTNLNTLIHQINDLRTISYAAIGSEPEWWLNALEKQCTTHRDELLYFAPWLSSPDSEQGLSAVRKTLDINMTLSQLADLGTSLHDIETSINELNPSLKGQHTTEHKSTTLSYLVRQGINRAHERIARIERLSSECLSLADCEFDFLYDPSRRLLAIGYDTTNHRRDEGFYDLLASEARLGSFVGISQGKLPVEHWFSLGRLVTIWKGRTMLLSWGGSMFEYLMPQLVMPTYENTLLDMTCRAIIERQIEYGKMRGDFWGISESAENMTDAGLNYQYRSFGIPDLGFKRGLANDLVIAPYASVLSLAYSPREACINLQKMSMRGFEGRYGFYEAIDYTAGRRAHDDSEALIKSFMSHHQGMSFISLVNFFTNNIMTKRFESDPLFHTTALLLQEKVPKAIPFKLPPSDIYTTRDVSDIQEEQLRTFTTPQTVFPEVHLLSNGRYHVMMTNSGGGYSRWRDLAVTRWREDQTRDNSGSFIYINDLSSEDIWSASYQPTLHEPKSYEAIFLQARAEFKRKDQGLDTFTEIAVSPEEDIEYRRVTVTNVSLRTKSVEITSYAEVVLLPQSAAEQHPAFSNLFVQTEIIKNQRSILCTRRPRSPDETNPWMFHLLSLDRDDIISEVSYETDRMKFIGRGRSPVNPVSVVKGKSVRLSGTEGTVLDAIASIRCTLSLKPGESATVGFITGMSETRKESLAHIEKYQDRQLADRVFELAMIHGRVALQRLNITESDAQMYGRLAGSILYANSSRRANPSVLMKNNRGQSGLWAYSISGDLPIVLLRIADQSKIEIAAKLIKAHAYWRRKGLQVDLVIWNEDFSGYRQTLNDLIMGLIASEPESSSFDKPGGIFLKHPDQMTEEDRILMLSVARVVLTDGGGTLAEQIRQTKRLDLLPYRRVRKEEQESEADNFKQNDLLFNNGFGGFTEDGREYIIHLRRGVQTPMPWVNVIANKRFGTVVSQSGAYTWYENAHEFRLTPWYNDPVCDTSGEALYLKDQMTGEFWSPTPNPSPGSGDYLNRHGFGYSVFEYLGHEIKSELWIYVDPDDPVKFSLLKVRNDSSSRRSLSASAFIELVLGDSRSKTQMHVRTEIDTSTGALFATNPYNTDFAGRVAFLESSESDRSISGDRSEFIGRNGILSDPSAMHRKRLSGKVGDGLDPAAAMQVYFDLEPGQEKEIVFIHGVGKDLDEARNLVLRYRSSLAAYQSRDRVWDFWKHTLGAVSIDTPDRALNLISNGWLVYQVLSSRLWARSGYYQSGGAFGFRDQLQDVTALLYSKPEMVREQILLCASKQFSAGDVQHWWHPPQGRGVRTLISDDYLWLPFVTALYVKRTGDTGVLDEQIPFLEGRQLGNGEESYYDLPRQSEEKGSVYEHCARAILNAEHFGNHGLPLMGSGDWNDGMNLVGIEGKGESVWLGFFLYKILQQFNEIALIRGDKSFAEKCSRSATELKTNLDSSAWDGEWFLRGFFDDGSPLGSSQNQECRIDAIAQSWAVLSGAASEERSVKALQSLEQILISPENGLIHLLDPPFNKSLPEPGYIKGYPPGIRENGGQYTHAAVWAVMAFAQQGHTEKMNNLLNIINPINHGSSPEQIEKYRVEPYVMAADIYSAKPYEGRGGWTWYTGSASWMYRLVIESVFGINLEIDKMTFTPCIPPEWKTCTIHYRYRETVYHISFNQQKNGTVTKVKLDGIDQKDFSITLVDNRKDHYAEIDI